MTIEESIEKILKAAHAREMSVDQIYGTFLSGIHADAIRARRELEESGVTVN